MARNLPETYGGEGADRPSGSGRSQAHPRGLEAAALRYDPSRIAPEIVAAGRGEVARRIVEIADEAGVPIREEASLAAVLTTLGAGAVVPPRLYAAVAEVLLWVARVDAERARRWLR